ncbi:hypothetical protein BP6252_07856 [Coleophoma cylindrospora]|uniref:Carboxymuconolactone decarboxylase-like domain-containing protein n=1 Tax=Coleophoma cylindrospora TaxID=1849047 RepID=A0A3D8RB66_9HELO|nr:hypothetical protein BP6252_07856 [Coleophoma cylindrospora]
MARAFLTPALLSSLSQQPNLPKDSWYFVVATTLCILNRPDQIPTVFQHAVENSIQGGEQTLTQESQLFIARRIRESLIKASAVGGVPKTINALHALKNATPAELQDGPFAPSPSSRRGDLYDTPVLDILQRGQDFFEKIYGKIWQRVMGHMDGSGTEDLGLIGRLTYAYVLSNVNILNHRETSFVLIAALVPQDVNPQLKGHLKGALNGGASVEEVKAIRSIVISVCKAAGMTQLDPDCPGGWGWREEVADL